MPRPRPTVLLLAEVLLLAVPAIAQVKNFDPATLWPPSQYRDMPPGCLVSTSACFGPGLDKGSLSRDAQGNWLILWTRLPTAFDERCSEWVYLNPSDPSHLFAASAVQRYGPGDSCGFLEHDEAKGHFAAVYGRQPTAMEEHDYWHCKSCWRNLKQLYREAIGAPPASDGATGNEAAPTLVVDPDRVAFEVSSVGGHQARQVEVRSLSAGDRLRWSRSPAALTLAPGLTVAVSPAGGFTQDRYLLTVTLAADAAVPAGTYRGSIQINGVKAGRRPLGVLVVVGAPAPPPPAPPPPAPEPPSPLPPAPVPGPVCEVTSAVDRLPDGTIRSVTLIPPSCQLAEPRPPADR